MNEIEGRQKEQTGETHCGGKRQRERVRWREIDRKRQRKTERKRQMERERIGEKVEETGKIRWHQKAKYIESWPNTTSAWAGRRGFDIPVDRYGGVHFLLQCTEAIFTNSLRTFFAKCSQTYSYLGWGWRWGEARIPPAAPTPLTLPYMLLYICTVHELCSRTVGEYRHWGLLTATRPASRKILIDQNIKMRTVP
jgi:hypothetical protein